MVNNNREHEDSPVLMIFLLFCIASFVIFVNYVVFGLSGLIIAGVTIALFASGNSSKLLQS